MAWKFFAPTNEINAVTALPSTAGDGDEILFVDSLSAPTYAWHLKYISAKSTNKWQFVGGSPMVAEVAANESMTSTTYAALTTAGPSVTVPVAGDYLVEFGALIRGGSDNALPSMSFSVGGTAASTADRIDQGPSTAEQTYASVSRAVKKSAVAASSAITAKYKVTSAGTGDFENRWLKVTPIAVGG